MSTENEEWRENSFNEENTGAILVLDPFAVT